MLQRLAVETAYFIDALLYLACFILDQFGVQTDPERLGTVVLVRSIPCLSFGLRYPLAIVVAGGVEHQVHAVLCCRALGHDGRVEHDGQNSRVVGHARFLAGSHEPLLAELRQELVFAVMVVNTIGEPDALEITLEGGELVRILIIRIVHIQVLQRTTDTEIVASVLVKEDVTTP